LNLKSTDSAAIGRDSGRRFAFLNELTGALAEDRNLCCQLTDKQLNQLVDYESGNEATIKWGIWHIADHNRYHQAHITQLRKCFSQS
jgi:hypothetical protein